MAYDPVYNKDVNLKIWARDYDYSRLDPIEQWKELHIDLKWADMSTWSAVMSTDEFTKVYGLTGAAGESFGCKQGIVVYRNDEPYPAFAGPIVEATGDWDKSGNGLVNLSGMSDLYFLTTRFIAPTWGETWPTNDYWPNYARHQYDTGRTVEDMQRAFLLYNIGPNASAADKMPYFTCAPLNSPEYGSTIDYYARFETCYEMVKKTTEMSTGGAVSGDADMSFDILNPYDSGTYRLYYTLFVSQDYSDDVHFGTDIGNVTKISLSEKRPEGNFIMGGGPDLDPVTTTIDQELGHRLFHSDYDAASIERYGAAGSIAGRVEEFFDCSNETGAIAGGAVTKAGILALMHQKVAGELKAKKLNATLTINLQPDEMTRFGSLANGSGDFRLGCKVSAKANKSIINDVIREVKMDFTPEKGEIITPIICDPWKFIWRNPLPFAHDNRYHLGEMSRNWR